MGALPVRQSQGPVMRFRTLNVSRQPGELARLRIVRGPDTGTTFVLFDTRATVGRGEDSSAMVSDLKASRLHAEFHLEGAAWNVRDLGSANGILVNDKPVRKSPVRSGDLVTIGETVIEFLGPEQGTRLLAAPAPDASQLEKRASERAVSRRGGRSLSDPFGIATSSSRPPDARKQGPGKYGRLALVGVLGIAALFLLDSGEKPVGARNTQKKARKGEVPGVLSNSGSNDIASLLPRLDPPAQNKTAEMFFKQGFREFRARNFLRARAQFDLVLQIVPDHEMALRYRDNCNREIEAEIKVIMESGRRSLESGKLREAKGHFETALRFLNGDQSHPAHKEAQDQLSRIQVEMERAD